MKRIPIVLSILALILSGMSLFVSLRFKNKILTRAIRATELTVERLALIDHRGTERLVLATGDKIPGPRLNNREFPAARRSGIKSESAGLLFYNSDGDEMGGIMWMGGKQKDGTYAQQFYFALDPYWGNEMFSLVLTDDNGRRTGGIQFQEWPITKDEFYILLEQSPEADRVQKKIEALRKEGKWPLRRFRIALAPDREELTMYDTAGKERLILGVDPDGKPYFHQKTDSQSN